MKFSTNRSSAAALTPMRAKHLHIKDIIPACIKFLNLSSGNFFWICQDFLGRSAVFFRILPFQKAGLLLQSPPSLLHLIKKPALFFKRYKKRGSGMKSSINGRSKKRCRSVRRYGTFNGSGSFTIFPDEFFLLDRSVPALGKRVPRQDTPMPDSTA